MKDNHVPNYLEYVDSVKPILDKIQFPVLDTISENTDSAIIESAS
jgi:hypothetical protein